MGDLAELAERLVATPPPSGGEGAVIEVCELADLERGRERFAALSAIAFAPLAR